MSDNQKISALPFEEYLAIDAINASSLKNMAISPLQYRYRQDTPPKDKDVFKVGRGSHTAVLEPDRFLIEYCCWRGGRRYGKKWDAFREAATDNKQTILTEEQYKTALKVRDAVREHRQASKILGEQGESEATIIWTHPRTGLKCKSRLDWMCSSLVDIKTTRDPSPAKFSSGSARFGYPIQFAFYADAHAALTGEMRPFKVIAAQSVAPYDVVVFDIPEETLRVGREQYEAALDVLVQCKERNEWPGIAPDEEVVLHLPAWAVPEADEDPLTLGGESIF